MITSFFLLPALLFIVIGVLLIAYSSKVKKKREQLTKDGGRAKGVVIDNDETLIGDKDYYFPIIEVNDPVKGTLKLRMKFGIRMPRTIGSEIEVVYDANNPSEAHEYGASGSLPTMIFYIGGIIFIIGGIIWSFFIIIMSLFINTIE